MVARTLAVLLAIGMASPAWAETASDYLQPCGGDRTCEVQRGEFTEAFSAALKRDYQGQRNVSFCLYDGCDGAVRINRTLGCAWRLVILNAGSPKADNTDVSFFDARCRSRLTGTEQSLMNAQGREIFRRVYGRAAPEPFVGVMTGARR